MEEIMRTIGLWDGVGSIDKVFIKREIEGNLSWMCGHGSK